MQDILPEQTSPSADHSPNGRLDSWKEIAVYFRRDVRTVRRWERSLGLPVHRHRQQRGVAVYAYKSEVDAWWKQRDEARPEIAPTPSSRRVPARLAWASLALLATIGLLQSSVWRTTRGDGPQSWPVTSYPGVEEYPSLSPDGNRLVFSWNGEQRRNPDIYTKALESSLADPVRLTSDPAPDFSPAWSPGGRSIAFLRQTGARELKVMMIPAVGGVERELTTARAPWDRAAGGYLAWTPDGGGLAFPHSESLDQPAGLFLFSLENGDVRRLTDPPGGHWGDSAPSFSPDGRQLAFQRMNTPSSSDIYLLSLNSDGTPAGAPRRVPGVESGAANPVWSSDGRELLYVSSGAEEPGIRSIAVSGSAHPAGLGLHGALPGFSLVGSKLVFSQRSFDSNIWAIDASGPRSARAASAWVASTRNDAGADFCPRGENAVYISDRSGSSELWICGPDGANSRQLTSFGGPRLAGPRWAPDGERIAFAKWSDGSAAIYTMHRAGGAPAPLTDGPAEDLWPSWSRDGRWIYFASNRGGDWQIWKTPAKSGPADAGSEHHPIVQVTRNGGNAAMESPEGRFLYFTKSHGVTTLWKAPIEGGAETQVAENLFGAANFYVTAGGVYFISRSLREMPAAKDEGSPRTTAARRQSESSSTNASASQPRDESETGGEFRGYVLSFTRFSTGETEQLTAIEQPADFGLTASPDGQRLLYPQWDQFEADLILQRLAK